MLEKLSSSDYISNVDPDTWLTLLGKSVLLGPEFLVVIFTSQVQELCHTQPGAQEQSRSSSLSWVGWETSSEHLEQQCIVYCQFDLSLDTRLCKFNAK